MAGGKWNVLLDCDRLDSKKETDVSEAPAHERANWEEEENKAAAETYTDVVSPVLSLEII